MRAVHLGPPHVLILKGNLSMQVVSLKGSLSIHLVSLNGVREKSMKFEKKVGEFCKR